MATFIPNAARAENLDLVYPAATLFGYLAIIDGDLSSAPATAVNVGADTISFSANPFTNLQRVRFTTTGTLPGGLVANTDYYVRNGTGTEIQLSATPAGPIIDITSAGTGTLTVTEQTLNANDSLGAIIAHEVTPTNRYPVTPETAVAGNPATKPLISISEALASTLTWQFAVLIKGGTNIMGDSTGSLALFSETETIGTKTVPASGTLAIDLTLRY